MLNLRLKLPDLLSSAHTHQLHMHLSPLPFREHLLPTLPAHSSLQPVAAVSSHHLLPPSSQQSLPMSLLSPIKLQCLSPTPKPYTLLRMQSRIHHRPCLLTVLLCCHPASHPHSQMLLFPIPSNHPSEQYLQMHVMSIPLSIVFTILIIHI